MVEISDITNSLMMAFEKECRKNGLVSVYHEHYIGNRAIVQAMAETLVEGKKLADAKLDTEDT